MKPIPLLALAGGLLAAAARAATPPPAEIPFLLEGANIVVEAEFPNGKRLPFIFDSGLGYGNLVTPETAQALGLKSDVPLTVHDAGGTQKAAGQTRIASLKVGVAQLGEQTFGIVPIPEAITERPGKPGAAGFLGAPLLKEAVLCIDYHHQRMQRWPRTAFDPAGETSVPLKLNHDLPTIVAQIDGRPATLIVDSGNDGTVVVYAAFAHRNGFRDRYPDVEPVDANGGSGETFQALRTRAHEFRIGERATFREQPMEIIRQGMDPAWGIDGMIGYGLLSQLDPCIDREGGRLLFKPAAARP